MQRNARKEKVRMWKLELELPEEYASLADREELLKALRAAAALHAKRATDADMGGHGYGGQSTIDTYHNTMEKRPHLYRAFKDFAIELRNRHSRRRFGANAIIERLRWAVLFDEEDVYVQELRAALAAEDDGETEFRVASSLSAFFPRRMLEEDESFVEFFEWRPSIADTIFPIAAELIAKQRLKDKGQTTEAAMEKPPSEPAPRYSGQTYYDCYIAPFTRRHGEGSSAI
jgi:hypothetical protein